jgi:uncharacterized membrane protein YfcA
MDTVWYIVAGIVSGVVAGMGMGGGTLLIPILTIFFNTKQQTSQGINLFAFLPTAVVSLIIHIKNKLVNFKIGIPIIVTGVLFSVSASILAINLESRLLQILFGGFLLLIGVYQLTTAIITIVKKKKRGKRDKVYDKTVYNVKNNKKV